MATTLGKRKRRPAEAVKNDVEVRPDPTESSDLDAQEIFRRHFEAKFKPLPTVKKVAKVVEEAPESDSEDESEWDGISEEEGESVEVIEHTDAQVRMAAMSKQQLKAFMVYIVFLARYRTS